MLDHPHCGLFVDMGLGKTLCTLYAFDMLRFTGKARTMLVIAPKKVAETTWSSECQKWEPLRHYRIAKVMGQKKERERAALSDADIYVLGRDNVKWFKDFMVRTRRRPLYQQFDVLVLDELTSFKSHDSQRFKALRSEAPRFRYTYGLTGTPAPNGYGDLWAEMALIDGGDALGRTITEFRNRYCYSFQYPGAAFTLYKVRDDMMDAIIKAIEPKVVQLSAKGLIELPVLRHRVSGGDGAGCEEEVQPPEEGDDPADAVRGRRVGRLGSSTGDEAPAGMQRCRIYGGREI